jgi:hypothetical protein
MVDPDLSLKLEPLRREPGFIVSGTANLPDDTVLRFGLWRGGRDGPFEALKEREGAVKSGRFVVSIGTGEDWRGLVSASVELRADRTQPPAVRRILGDAGEALSYVDLGGPGYRQVFAVTSLKVEEAE